MAVFEHLVEWDQLYLRVRGTKVQSVVSDLLRAKQLPVTELRLEFLEGELRVSARIQKGLSIPVKLSVYAVEVVGKFLRIRFEKVATFGMVPIPKLLFRVLGSRGLPDNIKFDAETLTVAVLLDRFLPGFLDLKIESIRIIQGGLAVHLGEGGADLPPANW